MAPSSIIIVNRHVHPLLMLLAKKSKLSCIADRSAGSQEPMGSAIHYFGISCELSRIKVPNTY
eukprot:scaffold4649_cov72-Cyclotella_meneghiniana.AAC.16